MHGHDPVRVWRGAPLKLFTLHGKLFRTKEAYMLLLVSIET